VGVALQWGLEIALSRDRAGGGVEGGAVVSAGFIEGSGVGAREVSKSTLDVQFELSRLRRSRWGRQVEVSERGRVVDFQVSIFLME
jgi:hypothetical protein